MVLFDGIAVTPDGSWGGLMTVMVIEAQVE
jgi:hypothetical protein